ncbi:DEAD/DEAH box helicase, partial [archaeon]
MQVLDEADRMLDMGFAEDVQKILDAVPGMRDFVERKTTEKQIQTVLFSATIPSWVSDVASKYMLKPVRIDLVEGTVAASVDVQHYILQCPWQVRAQTVADLIRVYGGADGRTIIFVETKKEADELAVSPEITSKVDVKAMHGDVPQSQRESTLAAFRKGSLQCIVATDVAARGLDIKGVDLVIQTQPPAGKFSGRADVDTYVHRSGRTGRAGAKGVCVTLYTRPQEAIIKQIEAATKNTFTRIGAPQPADIVRVSGEEAAVKLKAVHDDMVQYFMTPAEHALDGKDAQEVVARALAVIAGYTGAVSYRSLLSSSEGYQTFMFTAASPIYASSYVWTALRNALGAELPEEFRGLTLTADNMGAVFDVPASAIPRMKAEVEKDGSQLSIPTTLPELKDKGGDAMPAGRGYGGAGGRAGGFGGRGGGRGGYGG